mgnify:CR=1 FL=1
MYKITGVTHHSSHKTFAVSFDDGIIVILDSSREYHSMLSVGLDSYYLKNRKWPKGKSLGNRVKLGKEWVEKNKKRYKIKD